jgi:hypothetical protein
LRVALAVSVDSFLDVDDLFMDVRHAYLLFHKEKNHEEDPC